MRRSIRGFDVLGPGLALAFAGWIGTSAAVSGGRPIPMAALVLGVAAAAAGAHRIARIHPIAIPALVAASPVLAGVLNRGLLNADPLGYTNSSGALYFIAACGAVLVGLSVRRSSARIAAHLVATAWILAPWSLGATAAGVLAAALPLAVVLVHRRKAVRAVLLTGAGLAIAGLLFAAFLGSVGYRPGERANVLDRVFDTQLGESRVVLWGEALELVRLQPLTGVGPGRFSETSPTAASDIDLRWTHNEYLQVLAETGIPGGILLVALLLWFFARLWLAALNVRSIPAVVAFGGVLIHANIDFIWHFPEVPLALALLIGAGSGVGNSSNTVPLAPASSFERATLLSTLALWIALLLPIGAMSPLYTTANGARWASTGEGITFAARGIVRSAGPSVALNRRIAAAQALTLEVWVSTRNVDQHGPARIVSASDGVASRNFTLGQAGDRLVFRLRTTRTNRNGSDREIHVQNIFNITDIQHLVVATDLHETRVYADGQLRWRGPGPGGRLDNWTDHFPLLLGNETSGDRPWLGEIRLLSIYDQVLSAEDVRSAYEPGFPSAAPTLRGRKPRPVALYTFERNTRNIAADDSGSGLGPELEIPSRLRAPPDGFARSLADPAAWSVTRSAAHATLFAVWAVLLLRPARHGVRLRAAIMLMMVGGPGVAFAASAVRYLYGRLPSLADLLAAALGCAIASLVIGLRSRWQAR